jgi:hypothetical protein
MDFGSLKDLKNLRSTYNKVKWQEQKQNQRLEHRDIISGYNLNISGTETLYMVLELARNRRQSGAEGFL